MEIYRHAEKLTGKQVFDLFDKYCLFDHILEFYEILHVHGPNYIMEDLHDYMGSAHDFGNILR
jgi:hypothetical protein